MEKRFIVLLFLILSLTACSGNEDKVSKTFNPNSTTSAPMQDNMEKTFAENEEISLNLSYGERTGAYTGQLKDGLPHGEGTFSSVSPDGVSWIYRGQWSNGHCNGQGSTIWDSGQIEIGKYENDVLQGEALALSKDGKVYKGKFIKGAPSSTISILSELTDPDATQKMIAETNTADTIVSESEKATVSETVETSSAEPSKATTTEITMGMKNALSKSYSYLSYSAFSYSGLVDQLEYEGFSTEEATYAVDNCGADWNEQAAQKAQDYLDYSSFSRSGLIEQLEYEGFTKEQAEYGASAVGY
ncbi:hypothetical protein DXC92_18980 [Clostridiales bacterium TF09-2AC]|nr:hypothetical protein DXC92_18980 [Clostridiales bacterium TF09-2AC]